MTDLTEAEIHAAFSGQAVLVDRFVLNLNPTGVRMAFLERHSSGKESPKDQFRTAVLMSYPDALELRDLLNNMLAPIEHQVRTQMSASQTDQQAKRGG